MISSSFLFLLIISSSLSVKYPNSKNFNGIIATKPPVCKNMTGVEGRKCHRRFGILTYASEPKNPQGYSRCPCPKNNKGAALASLSYEPSYQAVTLEEALLNFKDLSSGNSEFAKTLVPSMLFRNRKNTESDLRCDNNDCKTCGMFILNGIKSQLKKVPPSNVINETLDELDKLASKLELSAQKSQKSDCAGFVESRKCEEFNCRKGFSKSLKSEDLKNLKASLQRKSSRERKTGEFESPLSNLLEKIPSEPIFIINTPTQDCSDPLVCPQPVQQRLKREQPEESPFETFVVIECLKKGLPLDSKTSYCGLCDTCWQWGILKETFLPRFVNILACDSSTRCLSGYGECRPRNTTLSSFVKNTGTLTNPKWEPYSINVPQMCDCQLHENSPLMPLATNT